MKKVWDRLGIAFSSACAVHCIIVAFLPLIFPALYAFTHQSWVHPIVLISMLITTPLAFLPGLRKHGLNWIMMTAISGIFLVLVGYLLEDRTSEQLSHGVVIVGSLLLVFAHAKNIQHSHRHHHQCC